MGKENYNKLEREWKIEEGEKEGERRVEEHTKSTQKLFQKFQGLQK